MTATTTEDPDAGPECLPGSTVCRLGLSRGQVRAPRLLLSLFHAITGPFFFANFSVLSYPNPETYQPTALLV
jgi:hypothetical protein